MAIDPALIRLDRLQPIHLRSDWPRSHKYTLDLLELAPQPVCLATTNIQPLCHRTMDGLPWRCHPAAQRGSRRSLTRLLRRLSLRLPRVSSSPPSCKLEEEAFCQGSPKATPAALTETLPARDDFWAAAWYLAENLSLPGYY